MRLLAMAFIAPGLVWAHDYKLGRLRGSPLCLIKTEPATRLEVYFRNFKNDGSQSDRLLGVSASSRQAIIRTETHSADHTLTWVPVQSLDVPAKGQVAMRHDARDGYQFLLTEIKRPLKVGDSFPLTLTLKNRLRKTKLYGKRLKIEQWK